MKLRENLCRREEVFQVKPTVFILDLSEFGFLTSGEFGTRLARGPLKVNLDSRLPQVEIPKWIERLRK